MFCMWEAKSLESELVPKEGFEFKAIWPNISKRKFTLIISRPYTTTKT